MADDKSLLPPLPVVRDHLTRNQRERSILRALFRLAVHATQKKSEPKPPTPRHEADGRGMVDGHAARCPTPPRGPNPIRCPPGWSRSQRPWTPWPPPPRLPHRRRRRRVAT